MYEEKQPTPVAEPRAETGNDNGQKAYLLFAVWFKAKDGVQRYRDYLEAASPIAKEYGARRVEFMIPVETLRGDFEPDYISIIEWPSVQAYYDFLKDLRYQAVSPMREKAVAKSAIIHCRRYG